MTPLELRLRSLLWLLPLCMVLAAIASVRCATVGYDEQKQIAVAYDGGGEATVGYDAFPVLAMGEKKSEAVGDHNSFAKSANFLAANSGLSVQLSQKGLDLVESHLGTFPPQPYNAGMMQNLQDAFAAGQKVTGANANFYLHEASEATFMQNGLSYDAAHAAALQKYGVSPYSLYAPNVIQANPTLFNNAWRAAVGLPPHP